MRHLLLFISMSVALGVNAQSDPYAQSKNVLNRQQDCQKQLSEISGKISARNREYEQEKKEYLAGEFCSDCKRTKSQIEKALRVSFGQHIQEGARSGRRIISATQEQMDQLHQRYMNDYNNLSSQFENTKKRCNDLTDQYNSTRNQEYQTQVKNAQEEANRQQQERMRLLEEQRRAEEEKRERQRILEQQERDALFQKIQATNDAVEAQKETYKKESDLGNAYKDRSAEARSRLTTSESADPNTVFGSYLNESGQTDYSRRQKLMNAMVEGYSSFKESTKNAITRLFGSRADESNVWMGDDEERPSSGWSFERTRLNRRIVQPLKNLYNKAYNIWQAGESYEDDNTRNYDLFGRMIPKTRKEARDDFQSANEGLVDRFSYGMDRITQSFNDPNDHYNSFDEDVNAEYTVNQHQTNAIGAALGEIPVLRKVGSLYKNTIGNKVDRLMNMYKYYKGNQGQ